MGYTFINISAESMKNIKFKYLYEVQIYTKDEEIQAFVWQVFIDQYFLRILGATSQEPNQILVLEFGYELDFVF
jgi:hypothetical protein